MIKSGSGLCNEVFYEVSLRMNKQMGVMDIVTEEIGKLFTLTFWAAQSLRLTHTIVNPRAVMVKLGYTFIADNTMFGSERATYQACCTELM